MRVIGRVITAGPVPTPWIPRGIVVSKLEWQVGNLASTGRQRYAIGRARSAEYRRWCLLSFDASGAQVVPVDGCPTFGRGGRQPATIRPAFSHVAVFRGVTRRRAGGARLGGRVALRGGRHVVTRAITHTRQILATGPHCRSRRGLCALGHPISVSSSGSKSRRAVKDDRNLGSAEESQTDLEPPATSSAGGAAVPPLERGTVLAGRYEIRKVIGRGGMGLVVEALDRILGEAIAIKILRAEYAGERTWAERLAREVKLARQIHHSNVCRVFDFAQADGRVFLTMELTSRGSLRDEINSGATATRPLADRIADVRALAAGLGAIHTAGIVHRDVSPQNVLRMPDGRAVLSDFGLATDSFESTTNVGGGTIAYMAPELIRSGRASVASDVWALGVVSHEIVFGERPHWRPGAHEMSSPISGRRLAPGERAVLEICRVCTAPDPERRPQRVAEIAAQLSDVGMRRSAWRRRAGRAVAVVCVGAAMVGVVGGVRRVRAKRAAGGAAAAGVVVDPLLIVPTGVPDDWTEKTKVLAECRREFGARLYCPTIAQYVSSGDRPTRFPTTTSSDQATGQTEGRPAWMASARHREAGTGCSYAAPGARAYDAPSGRRTLEAASGLTYERRPRRSSRQDAFS